MKPVNPYPGGGGYLVYLPDGDVPFFRVSFSPIFSRTGHHLKAKIQEPGKKIFLWAHACAHLGQVAPPPLRIHRYSKNHFAIKLFNTRYDKEL